LDRLDLCLEIINLRLEILKGLTLRPTISGKSPFRDQNQKGNRDKCQQDLTASHFELLSSRWV